MIPLAKIVRVEVDVAVRRIPLQAVVSPGVGTGLQVSRIQLRLSILPGRVNFLDPSRRVDPFNLSDPSKFTKI